LANLADLTSRYRIIVDTCSLMNPGAEFFFMKSLPTVLKQYKAKLFIYSCVAGEAYDLINSKQLYTKISAGKASSIIKKLTIQGLTEIVEGNRGFTDHILYCEIARLRKDHNILLITQDRNLSKDVLFLNRIRSARFATDIQVFWINNSGKLISWSNSLPPIDVIKPMAEPSKLPSLTTEASMMPAGCSIKAIEFPKPPVIQKSLPAISPVNKEAIQKKSKGEAAPLLRRRLVNIPVLGNEYSAGLRRTQNNNLIERLLRSVSQIFRHQGSSIGLNRW